MILCGRTRSPALSRVHINIPSAPKLQCMMSSASPEHESEKAPSPSPSMPDVPIVQYVVLRKDLWSEKGWPLGSIVAQACHASSAGRGVQRGLSDVR